MVAEDISISPAVAQLRGEIVTMLTQIEDEDELLDLFHYLKNLVNGVDMLEDMPPHAIKELEIAIEESYDESDTVPHEEVMKMAREWAKG
ncbi:MAG: hypothetical protein H7246_15525 [Phycisphaerae bacterium]|nr:hypothetical protein [Saprospiraceae bacterium]